jgi:hypothetical protein
MDCLHDIHPGIVKMKSLARMHVWCPNIDINIEETVRSCQTCQSQQCKPVTPTNP